MQIKTASLIQNILLILEATDGDTNKLAIGPPILVNIIGVQIAEKCIGGSSLRSTPK